jgi:hypothetical protein
MASTVQSLLKYKALSALYAESDYNVQTPLLDMFFSSPVNVDTDEYDLLVDPTDTTPAPLNRRDGSARSLGANGLTQRRGTLFRTFNYQAFNSAVMQSIQEPDSHNLDQKGAREIARQTASFRRKHAILKQLIVSKILSAGTVYWDRATGLVAESSGTDNETVTFGVPAANQTNLGGEITMNLSNTSFDFWSLFEFMDATSASNNSAPVTDVIVNNTAKEYIRNNLQFQKWAALAGMDAQAVLRGDMVAGMFGKNWHFVGQYYTNDSGTKVKLIPDSKLIAIPSPTDRSWYEAANGSTLVPTSIGIGGSAEQVLSNVQTVYGPFSYAKVKDNPVSVEQYAGDCFGFNFVDPNAIYQCTVTGY